MAWPNPSYESEIMTAEVRFMNLKSHLWREGDQESYMKCVFFNTSGMEFVFTDLDNDDPDAMSVHLNKDHEVFYLTADEVSSKIMHWYHTKQETVVSRQDEVLGMMKTIVENPNISVEELMSDNLRKFIPVELN